MAEIPKIVGQRLQTMAQLKDHPDPNLLSAFVERSLGKIERIQVFEHLSGCASCREVVSLSATQPEISVVAVAPAGAGWLSWPGLRWGAAVACVVVVGAVVTLHQRREQQITTMVAAERPTDAQISAKKSGIEKAVDKVDKKLASREMTDSEAKPLFAAKQLASWPKASTASRVDGTHPLAPPSPVEMADARAGSPLAEVVPGRAKDALVEPQDNQSEKSISAVSSRSRSMALAGSASNAAIPAGLAPRWTLSSDGTLQRSLDSGASWQTIVVSSKTVFRALAANDLDIWVGGSAGALFHSSDAGERWTQVRPVANGEALEDDIVGVEFTDTLHGKLTSSVEETWITADAGQTWQKE